MFGYIRIAIGFVIFILLGLLIWKSKIVKKKKFYAFSAIITFIMTVVLSFLPFENLFVTFDSPQAVYQYMRNEKLNNEFVVEGEQCDLIIDRKSGSKRELFVVSKTSDGWKINAGIGLGMSEIKSFDTVVIDLYQYKNTGEYFISIIDMNGGELEISDKNNAKFYSVRDYDVFLEEAYYTYYANVPKLDSDYYIVINGNEIKLQD